MPHFTVMIRAQSGKPQRKIGRQVLSRDPNLGSLVRSWRSSS